MSKSSFPYLDLNRATLLEKASFQEALNNVGGDAAARAVAGATAAVIPNGVDDTGNLQIALNMGVVILAKGAKYRVTKGLTVRPGRTIIVGNNSTILFRPAERAGAVPSLFSNDSKVVESVDFSARDFSIEGSCVALEFGFLSAKPKAGLRVIIDSLHFNTMDGSRPMGTGFAIIKQADFSSFSNLKIYNCDLAFSVGSKSPDRNSTQIILQNHFVSQVNTGYRFEGVDKLVTQNIDIANCGSGFCWLGSNARHSCSALHVESLSTNGYKSSPKVPLSSSGTAFYFEDNAQNEDIVISCSDVIDMKGQVGNARASIFVGRCDNPAIQSIYFNQCTIPPLCEGSAVYQPLVIRGYIEWSGKWPLL